MGWWDYTNIGASAKPENKKHIQKIFEYIGFAAEPGYAPDGEECSFMEPDVYGCWKSANDYESGHVKEEFVELSEKDLLYLLNALFPKTKVYVHHAEGNNTSDTWENHDKVYNPENMTLECNDSYTDYGGDGPMGDRSWKERFALQPPKMEYVHALTELSTADRNTELTAILLEIAQSMREGLIVYKNDDADKRTIGERYDIIDNVEGEEDSEDEDEWEEDEIEEGEDNNTENDVFCEQHQDEPFVIENGVLVKCRGGLLRNRSVELPIGITSIGDNVFQNFSGLSSIVIPEGVTKIGKNAFTNCVGLISVVLPSSITSIGDNAFRNCVQLKKLTIPENVTNIGAAAFWGCINLTIKIPDGVVSIGESAFVACKTI